MPKILIEFDIDNAAFEDLPMMESARILRHLAREINETGFVNGDIAVRDINGNVVGRARLIED